MRSGDGWCDCEWNTTDEGLNMTSKETVAPFTCEVFARRFLGETYNHETVSWADQMVLSGYETDHLFILLGECAPFNQFEFDVLIDRVQEELKIPNIENRKEAIETIVTLQILRSRWKGNDAVFLLRRLMELCDHDNDTKSLIVFHDLYWLADEVHTAASQGYNPKYSIDDVEAKLRKYNEEWIDTHTLDKWVKFEWSTKQKPKPSE